MSVLNLVHERTIPKRNAVVISLLKDAQFKTDILTDFRQIDEKL